jgi:hypothetical protein
MATQGRKEPDLEAPSTAEDISLTCRHQTLLESCYQPTTRYVQQKFMRHTGLITCIYEIHLGSL